MSTAGALLAPFCWELLQAPFLYCVKKNETILTIRLTLCREPFALINMEHKVAIEVTNRGSSVDQVEKLVFLQSKGSP